MEARSSPEGATALRLSAPFLFTFALLISRATTYADPPAYSGDWEHVFTTPVHCAAVDSDGRLDVVVTHGDHISASIEQFNAIGGIQWMTNLASATYVHAYAMTTDAAGNILV